MTLKKRFLFFVNREGKKKRHTLQNLEVLDVGIFGIDVEFDLGHWHINYRKATLVQIRPKCIPTINSKSEAKWASAAPRPLPKGILTNVRKMLSKIWQYAAL
jgi:hypothetical protein